MDTQNSLFSEKFKKFFKNTLHYICTGRGQFVGCFAKKFKIPLTYSHWEKPNSASFLKKYFYRDGKSAVNISRFVLRYL